MQENYPLLSSEGDIVSIKRSPFIRNKLGPSYVKSLRGKKKKLDTQSLVKFLCGLSVRNFSLTAHNSCYSVHVLNEIRQTWSTNCKSQLWMCKLEYSILEYLTAIPRGIRPQIKANFWVIFEYRYPVELFPEVFWFFFFFKY